MNRGLRITGGIYRGRRVTCPPGIIRPAMDRMRESVFAVLGDLSGDSFLDLFCGSGIIGIEAASRGAAEITFVEKDRRKMGILKANIELIETKTYIASMPAERFLGGGRKFDIIFADPPFNYKNKRGLVESVGKHDNLKSGGILLVHYPAEDTMPAETEQLTLYDERKYGRSIVGFWQPKGPN